MATKLAPHDLVYPFEPTALFQGVFTRLGTCLINSACSCRWPVGWSSNPGVLSHACSSFRHVLHIWLHNTLFDTLSGQEWPGIFSLSMGIFILQGLTSLQGLTTLTGILSLSKRIFIIQGLTSLQGLTTLTGILSLSEGIFILQGIFSLPQGIFSLKGTLSLSKGKTSSLQGILSQGILSQGILSLSLKLKLILILKPFYALQGIFSLELK